MCMCVFCVVVVLDGSMDHHRQPRVLPREAVGGANPSQQDTIQRYMI